MLQQIKHTGSRCLLLVPLGLIVLLFECVPLVSMFVKAFSENGHFSLAQFGTIAHQLHHAQTALALKWNALCPRSTVQIVPLECPAHCCGRFLKTQNQPLGNTNAEIIPLLERFRHHITQQFFLFAHFHAAEHQHFSAWYGQTHAAISFFSTAFAACHIRHAVSQPVCKCCHQLFPYTFSLNMNFAAAGIYNIKLAAGEHRARIPQLVDDGKGKANETRCMCKGFDVMIHSG